MQAHYWVEGCQNHGKAIGQHDPKIHALKEKLQTLKWFIYVLGLYFGLSSSWFEILCWHFC